MKYLQSKCFFFGPIISCVVALHTVLDIAEPVTLCWAAVILSVMLCPDIPNPTKCSFTVTQMCPRTTEWPAFNGSVFKHSVLPDKTREQREMDTESTKADVRFGLNKSNSALQKKKKTDTNNFGNKHWLKTQKRTSTFKHYDILTRKFNRSHVYTSSLLFPYNSAQLAFHGAHKIRTGAFSGIDFHNNSYPEESQPLVMMYKSFVKKYNCKNY